MCHMCAQHESQMRDTYVIHMRGSDNININMRAYHISHMLRSHILHVWCKHRHCICKTAYVFYTDICILFY